MSLFYEKIFGPVKDYMSLCGAEERKGTGTICDSKGVEATEKK